MTARRLAGLIVRSHALGVSSGGTARPSEAAAPTYHLLASDFESGPVPVLRFEAPPSIGL